MTKFCEAQPATFGLKKVPADVVQGSAINGGQLDSANRCRHFLLGSASLAVGKDAPEKAPPRIAEEMVRMLEMALHLRAPEERQEQKDKMFKQMDWSKMAPYVQEAILKMAAEKLFNKGEGR